MNRTGSQAAITSPAPHEAEEFGQVLPFRRPGQPPPIRSTATDEADIDDLARYEQDRDEQDLEEAIDYRQRMFMNVVALAIVTLLVSTGVWLADSIAAMERDQDCVMQGRVNCAPIEVTGPVQP